MPQQHIGLDVAVLYWLMIVVSAQSYLFCSTAKKRQLKDTIVPAQQTHWYIHLCQRPSIKATNRCTASFFFTRAWKSYFVTQFI